MSTGMFDGLSREDDVTFDWFKSYNQIADIVKELMPNYQSRILMLGCGNSSLSQEVTYVLHDHLVRFPFMSVDVR